MNQKAIVIIGVAGVILSALFSIFSLIPWQVAGVLIAVSIGIPTLLLKLEEKQEGNKKNQTTSPEKNQTTSPEKNQTTSPEKNQTTSPIIQLNKEKSITSQLQPEISVITKLGTEEGFLDRIFDEAQREALDTFNDARLSNFAVQGSYEVTVSPSEVLYVYFDFYSKWANKVCKFQHSSINFKLKHYKPNKQARFDFEKEVFNDLPWKTNPHFLQALNKVYDKIKPLPAIQGTWYQISKRVSDNWNITFEDGSNGNEYSFEWNGLGLDENSIKQTY